MAPFVVTCYFSLCMVVTRYAASILCFPAYPIAEPSLSDPQIALSVDDLDTSLPHLFARREGCVPHPLGGSGRESPHTSVGGRRLAAACCVHLPGL
jgi:hypothetical protein